METESWAAGPSVRLAAGTDVPALADVLAQAFDADPFFRWIVGDGPRRAERSRRGWAGILRCASAGLSATWTTDDLAGVALWIPPGRPFSSFWDNLRLTPSLARLTGWRRLPVTASAIAEMERHHARHMPGAHAYLSALGVAPGRQGQGIGTALIRPMLESCDREGVLAYLETANPRNVPLYERLGFAVVDEITLAAAGVSGWLMRRRPQPRS